MHTTLKFCIEFYLNLASLYTNEFWRSEDHVPVFLKTNFRKRKRMCHCVQHCTVYIRQCIHFNCMLSHHSFCINALPPLVACSRTKKVSHTYKIIYHVLCHIVWKLWYIIWYIIYCKSIIITNIKSLQYR